MAIYRYDASDVIQDLQANGDIETYVQNVVDARTSASKRKVPLGVSFPEPIIPETLGNTLFTSLMQGYFPGPFENGDVSFAAPSWLNRMNSTVALQLLLTREEVSQKQKEIIGDVSTQGIPHYAELAKHGAEVMYHLWEPKDEELIRSGIRHKYGRDAEWAIRYNELKPRQVSMMKYVVKKSYDFFVVSFQSKFPFSDILLMVSQDENYLKRVTNLEVDRQTYRAYELAADFPLKDVPRYKQEYIEMVIRQAWSSISASRIAGRLAYASDEKVGDTFKKKLKEKSEAVSQSWISTAVPAKK
jgi:hypothetical protein